VAGEHLTHQQAESRPADQPGFNVQRPRFRPAWFAGFDLRALNQVGSEWTIADALGLLVAAMCFLSGIAATVAVGYVVDKPALHLAWFGGLWMCLIVCVERVILQMPNPHGWLSALGSFVWRAALSVLLAFLIAEPVTMLFHQPEINAQLNHNTREAIEEESHAIDANLKPRFRDAHEELRNTRNRKADLEAKLAADHKRQAVAEEHGLTGVAVAAASLAKLHERRLTGAVERNEQRQPALHQKLDNLTDTKREKKEEAEREIKEGNGFEARVAALADVEDKWTSTKFSTWGLRWVFLILDLTALVATVVYQRRPGAQPYEEHRDAAREWDSLPALRVKEAVRVEKQRIKEEARGEMRVNQAQIAGDVERRIYGMTGDSPGFASSAPVSAMPFDEFVENIEHHETRPVDVPQELRRSALIGLALLGAAAVIAFLLTSAGTAVSGAWLLVIALGLATALCVYTHGFRQAPAWAMRPVLATFIAGLVLPPFVLVLNV
jgi:hypothetical protein